MTLVIEKNRNKTHHNTFTHKMQNQNNKYCIDDDLIDDNDRSDIGKYNSDNQRYGNGVNSNGTNQNCQEKRNRFASMDKVINQKSTNGYYGNMTTNHQYNQFYQNNNNNLNNLQINLNQYHQNNYQQMQNNTNTLNINGFNSNRSNNGCYNYPMNNNCCLSPQYNINYNNGFIQKNINSNVFNFNQATMQDTFKGSDPFQQFLNKW